MPLHIHAIVEYPDNQNLIILNHIDNKVTAMMMNTNRWGKFGAFPADKWRLAEKLKTIFQFGKI
jgi:REP element-mobilizing transposase RayT